MLEMLVRNRGKLVGREELLKEVWGPAYAKETHYLRVYLAQLRRKLEDDPVASQTPADRSRHGLPFSGIALLPGRRDVTRSTHCARLADDRLVTGLLTTLTAVEGVGVAENTQAYNSVWQLRSDSWCRLEEAADRLCQPTTTGDFKDTYMRTCHDLLAKLARVELYWAYPGPEEFAKAQRLFTSGQLRQILPRRVRDQPHLDHRVVSHR